MNTSLTHRFVFEQNADWKLRLVEGRRTGEYVVSKQLNTMYALPNPMFLVSRECQACFQRGYVYKPSDQEHSGSITHTGPYLSFDYEINLYWFVARNIKLAMIVWYGA
jgi:hypothetical protein